MPDPLTIKQLQTLDIIKNYIAKHRVAPTLGEIAFLLDEKSTSTAQYLVGQLIVKGFIKHYPDKVRGLEIIEK